MHQYLAPATVRQMDDKVHISNVLTPLQQQAARLRDQGAAQFWPGQLTYIEQLLVRLQQRDSTATLWDKLDRGLTELESLLDERRADLQRRLSAQQPNEDEREQWQTLLDEGRLHELHCQLKRRELRKSQQWKTSNSLTAAGVESLREEPIAQAISNQDESISRAMEPAGLQAANKLREQWAQDRTEQLLQQAIEHLPKDTGPLNPQRLATHSLLMMAKLSPQYLHQFSLYIDTLAWLDDLRPTD